MRCYTDKTSKLRNEADLYSYKSKLDSSTTGQHSKSVLKFLASGRKRAIDLSPLDINFLLKKHETLLLQHLRENTNLNMVLAEDLPPILADISLFEQILFTLTSNLRYIFSKRSDVTFITNLAELYDSNSDCHDRSHPSMLGEYVILSMIESRHNMDHLNKKTSKPSPQDTKVNKGFEFRISIVSSMLDQQGGRLTWNVDSNQRNKIEVYLPKAK